MSNSYASSLTVSTDLVPELALPEDKEKQSPPQTDEIEHPFEAPKGWRKLLLVSLLCGAQFFDIFTACSAIAALPTVRCFIVPLLDLYIDVLRRLARSLVSLQVNCHGC